MRYLPFAFALTRGSELARVVRAAAEDPRRRALCPTCGGRMPIHPEVAEQTVRCPHCWRWQRVAEDPQTPWRLSDSAVLALRRTRAWARHL